jgi:hypothetical protein
MSAIKDFVNSILTKRKDEAVKEPIADLAVNVIPVPIATQTVPKAEVLSAKQLYEELSGVQALRKEIVQRKNAAQEKFTILRQRAHANSMNNGWYGSPIGDSRPDGTSIQQEANKRSNLRMRKVFDEIKLQLKYAEKELFDLQAQDKELEAQERELLRQFSIQSSIEALENEKLEVR